MSLSGAPLRAPFWSRGRGPATAAPRGTVFRRAPLFAGLAIAAAARILLAIAAMPPYAGLDEIQHVARLVFVMQEHRNPTTAELSIAPYLNASIHQQAGALPSFSQVAEHWPDVVRANPIIVRERELRGSDLRPYVARNYEAQQPSVYYELAAPLGHSLPRRSAVAELRLWRMVSGAFAVIIVLATAAAGEAMFGSAGIVAAAMLLVLPTWITLVVRASNDGMACALVACAFAVTVRKPQGPAGWIAEGLLWGAAFATKLYTWPIGIVPVLFWWKDRASFRRVGTVVALSGAAIVVTLLDLSRRTGNILGVVAFDRPGTGALDSGSHISEIVRVTIASFAWTSGQHNDALTPLAIVLFLGPVLVAVILACRPNRILGIGAAAVVAFGCAQAFNAVSCVLARRAGNPIPVGGKEGWYWYAIAPIVVATVLSPLIARRARVAAAIFVWMTVWDVLITEGALFHDYAGATSPMNPTPLFRWGPMFAPFTADLRGIGIGPFSGGLMFLRGVQILAVAALFVYSQSSVLARANER